ncbi:MAG TPA: undecaprenyldiphospho-muramoylpentapeptide beta-N-acetylglucosaminyltransferase [Puia sp.]|nr:undecaprenyldiphospho-muramoylpentapeptide beta-N-acetylglucosaminyltransferase [Puia sp.]
MKKTIVFTGGGSAGHVTANLALIPEFIRMGWSIIYIGSKNGIESGLIEKFKEVNYLAISTGKLRRYFSVKNFTDPFRVINGIFQAYKFIRKYKPDVVFSRGGFVSVPVVLAAWLNRVPIVMHESNITPGLANRITAPFATKICLTFSETMKYIRSKKTVEVGPIIRNELKTGNLENARSLCGFSPVKPVILIMGGSLGSKRINEIVRRNIGVILDNYQVVHICGKGGADQTCQLPGYKQFEYIYEELADLFAMADFVISRAGANSICEFLSLHKPMLLIPLPLKVSRGDQVLNAESFQRNGYAEILWEKDLTDSNFLNSISRIASRKSEMCANMQRRNGVNSLSNMVGLIKSSAK